MVNRVVLVVILVPLAVILIALAVANREMVAFVFLFLALALGMIVGSLATWVRQGRYRKLARRHGAEAESLRQAIARTPSPTPPRPSP